MITSPQRPLFWWKVHTLTLVSIPLHNGHLFTVDCEQSLFSQLSLSSAGLERANWPKGKLHFAQFPRSMTIPRDCSQSIFTPATFFCPQGGLCGEVQLYLVQSVTGLCSCSSRSPLVPYFCFWVTRKS